METKKLQQFKTDGISANVISSFGSLDLLIIKIGARATMHWMESHIEDAVSGIFSNYFMSKVTFLCYFLGNLLGSNSKLVF